jgi:hypothetical protein
MANYKQVPSFSSEAPRFEITAGLREGYGADAVTHTVEEATAVVLEHLKDCAAQGRPYLTGTLTTGEVVYAWPEGEGRSGGGHEPVVVYSGHVNPLYNTSLSELQVWEFLEGMASALGNALVQTRIYVVYRDEMRVLQREDTETPTGETV